MLNTGTTPAAPPVPGLADTAYWTNRDAVRATELPDSLAIIGGGTIGCELAQVFASFGVHVTVIEAADRILAMEEPEATQAVMTAFHNAGITVLTGARAQHVQHNADRFTIGLGGQTVTAERLLVAAGRRNNLADIGLEHIGLDPTTRVLDPDERMRVADGVWAIGDITGKGAFTHMSMYQADLVIRDIRLPQLPPSTAAGAARAPVTPPEPLRRRRGQGSWSGWTARRTATRRWPFAFDAAAARSADLLALHAWSDTAFGADDLDGLIGPDQAREIELALLTELSALAGQVPRRWR